MSRSFGYGVGSLAGRIFVAVTGVALQMLTVLAQPFGNDGSAWSVDGKPVVTPNGVLETPPGLAAFSPAQPVPYELRFEALVPGEAQGVSNSVTPQIWFSVEHRNETDRLAVSLRGGRLQDAVAYDFAQRNWSGPVSENWLAPENSAFRFHFARLPAREILPVAPGKWVAVWVGVGGQRTYVNVDGKPVMSVPRAAGAANTRIALGGSWQANVFRSVSVCAWKDALRDGDPFAPRKDYPEALLKVDFGPDQNPAAEGWLRTGIKGAGPFVWRTPPAGTRERPAKSQDPRLSTLVFWAHGKKAGEASVQLPAGDFLVSVGVGDAGYPCDLTLGAADGKEYAAKTAAGSFTEVRFPVSHAGGSLNLLFSVGDQLGGSANYLVVQPAHADRVERSVAVNRFREAEAEERRKAARQRYKAISLPELAAAGVREFSLDGDWLFMPAGGCDAKAAPQTETPDADWHLLPVPGFWNATGWWIFGQGSRHVSLAFLYEELARCEQLTFDWRSTKAGWYRKHVEVPRSFAGRQVTLDFEGVASQCDVYMNGALAGSSVGMFKPFSVDVTTHLLPGRQNVLAVWVGSGEGRRAAPADRGASEVAVTMTVSRDMVMELPRAIYSSPVGEDGSVVNGRQGGIWQPVRLRASAPAGFDDVSPQAGAGELRIRLAAHVAAAEAEQVRVRLRLSDDSGQAVLEREVPWPEVSASGSLAFSGLPVAPWSFESPRLYDLDVELVKGTGVLDQRRFRLGFRSFTIRDGQFHLNGKPWRFLGANMPPHGLRPNDTALAREFVALMRAGNQRALRAVCSPLPGFWLDETDKQGIAVSYEGTWPWVLIGNQDIPDASSLKAWKEEWIALVKANRHRPSVFMWTINNENYFVTDGNKERLQQKWDIWQDIVKATREADPTRPVVLWSGYARKEIGQGLTALAGAKDDGDIDDRHTYAGTYTPSMIGVPDWWATFLAANKTAGRPLISQEAGTAYANTDLGHQELSYLQTWHGQIWTGRESYPFASPDFFLERTARLTKEQLEITRREAVEGWLAFCNATWYQNVDRAGLIRPYPAHEAVRLALQPRLVALLRPPHRLFEGDSATLEVFAVNDAESLLGCDWTVDISVENTEGQSIGTSANPVLKEPRLGGGVQSDRVRVDVGELGLNGRRAAFFHLVARTQDGSVIGENRYEVGVFSKGAVKPCSSVRVFGPADEVTKWQPLLAFVGISPSPQPADAQFAVALSPGRKEWGGIMQYAEAGGRVLVLSPSELPESAVWQGARLEEAGYRGEVAGFTEAGLMAGLNRGLDVRDLAWWSGSHKGRLVYEQALTFSGPLSENIQPWVVHAPPHGYDARWRMDFPLVRFPAGKGELVVCTLNFQGLEHDPAPRTVLSNLIRAVRH